MSEIMIDGVDVSECRFIDEWEHCKICKELNDGHCLIVKDIECKTYACYYKQLKRIEQENAELKETIQELNKAIQDCNIQRTRLYKTLEEIREIAKCRIENLVIVDMIDEVLK